jgi:hypothetical protein
MKDGTTSQEGASRGPNCWDCRFLAITWDTRMPYGCKLLGFRSRVIPSMEVLRTDGRFCVGFEPKPVPNNVPATPVEPQRVNAVNSPTPRRQSDPFKPFKGINVVI